MKEETPKKYVDYCKLLQHVFPNLTIQNTKWIDLGDHSLAVIVNEEWIFRFPRQNIFYEEYRREKVILEQIRKTVTTPVPEIALFETKNILFSKHKLLPGEQYSSVSSKLSDITKEKLAEKLAQFLTELHAISPKDIPLDWKEDTPDWVEEVLVQKALLFPLLTRAQQTKFEKVLTDFEVEKKESQKELFVLCHNDLNENNFLIHENHLSGVIDFGNATIRPFSVEFASLMKYDFILTQKIARIYEQRTNRKVNLRYALLIQKLRCYCGILEHQQEPKKIMRYFRWLETLETKEFL